MKYLQSVVVAAVSALAVSEGVSAKRSFFLRKSPDDSGRNLSVPPGPPQEDLDAAAAKKGPEPDPEEPYDAYEKPSITKKYKGLETVNEVLFTIACRSKHTTDVRGQARENLGMSESVEKSSDMDSDEFMQEVKKVQKENVAQMKKTCGLMNGKHWKTCRETCKSGHDTRVGFSAAEGVTESYHAEAKVECTELCDKKYSQFDSDCVDQSSKLADVYETERGTMGAGGKCVDLHCPDFPELALEEDESAQTAKVGELCGKQCSSPDAAEDCKSKCEDGCRVNRLNKCTQELTKKMDIMKDYCSQLWQWMYDMEAIDPRSGNPMVSFF
jgi:hypothetical protein